MTLENRLNGIGTCDNLNRYLGFWFNTLKLKSVWEPFLIKGN